MRGPKLKEFGVEKGFGKSKQNMEVDEVGGLRGRIHVENRKQNLGKLQTRKMKGLTTDRDEVEQDEDENISGQEDELIR